MPIAGRADTTPASIFGKQCSGCHTYGKGVKVGPDLKGVTTRRSRAWLHKFIRSSRSVIQAKDAVAMQLFQQFKQQQMPDWDLSDQQIDALLDYFATNGPEKRPIDQKNAALASAADVARGRMLFMGEMPLHNTQVACNSCHTVTGGSGGSLGPDLTTSYARYQDQASTSRLKRPCPPMAASITAGTYLTPDELFALKAYLRQAAVNVRAGFGVMAPGGWPEGGDAQRNFVLFALWPYAAALLFFLGLALRYAKERKRTAVVPRTKLIAAPRFAVALLVLFLAHLTGLALPQSVLQWNHVAWRLYALEAALFAVALVALGTSCAMVWRLLRKPEKSPTAIADCAAGTLIVVAIASGLILAIVDRWASSWGVVALAPYIVSLLRFAPKDGVFGSMPMAVRLHVFSAFAALAAVPFTTAGRVAVAALKSRSDVLVHAFETRLVQSAAALRVWVERGLLARIWPEEEE